MASVNSGQWPARQIGLNRLVDIATRTGAIRVALGNFCTGAFTNNQELMDAVVRAVEAAGERIWQFPMYEEYKEQKKARLPM